MKTMVYLSELTCSRCGLVNSAVNSDGLCGLCTARANEASGTFWNFDDVTPGDLYTLALAIFVMGLLLAFAPWGTR